MLVCIFLIAYFIKIGIAILNSIIPQIASDIATYSMPLPPEGLSRVDLVDLLSISEKHITFWYSFLFRYQSDVIASDLKLRSVCNE